MKNCNLSLSSLLLSPLPPSPLPTRFYLTPFLSLSLSLTPPLPPSKTQRKIVKNTTCNHFTLQSSDAALLPTVFGKVLTATVFFLSLSLYLSSSLYPDLSPHSVPLPLAGVASFCSSSSEGCTLTCAATAKAILSMKLYIATQKGKKDKKDTKKKQRRQEAKSQASPSHTHTPVCIAKKKKKTKQNNTKKQQQQPYTSTSTMCFCLAFPFPTL